MKKVTSLLVILICSLQLNAQTTKTIEGKYCEDLGFGWYCITFKKNGTYTEEAGHSYQKNKSTGTWTLHNDTIVTRGNSKHKTEDSDTEIYLLTDSLYSVYFNYAIKQWVRGKALIKN